MSTAVRSKNYGPMWIQAAIILALWSSALLLPFRFLFCFYLLCFSIVMLVLWSASSFLLTFLFLFLCLYFNLVCIFVSMSGAISGDICLELFQDMRRINRVKQVSLCYFSADCSKAVPLL